MVSLVNHIVFLQTANSLLVSCKNGKVVEIVAPTQSDYDTSHSFHLSEVNMKYFTFQSVKSELRRDEERERKAIAKAARRKTREKELKRRKEAGNCRITLIKMVNQQLDEKKSRLNTVN